MSHAVEDGEPETQEGDVLVARDVLAVGVADEQVHGLVLDPLVQQEHVAGGAHVHLAGNAGGELLDALLELLARRSGDDVHGPHVDGHQELHHADELVGIAAEGDLLVVIVLGGVAHHVHELAALAVDVVGHGRAGHDAQGVDEAVGGGQSEGNVQHLAGHLALGVQVARGVGAAPLAQGERAHGVAGLDELLHGHAALGEHVVLAGERTVQNARGVGEERDGHVHQPGQALDLLHVGGLHPAGNDVDLAVLPARALGELGHALAHAGEAGDMAAHVRGGVAVDDVLALGNEPLLGRLVADLLDVVADGLRQARGVHGDDLGVVDGEDVLDGLQQVGLAAEHARALGEGAGGCGDRLLVVPGQRAAVIGAAALAAVTVGQAAVDAQRRVHGADGLTGLGRIDGHGVAVHDLFWGMPEQHIVILAIPRRRWPRVRGSSARGPSCSPRSCC